MTDEERMAAATAAMQANAQEGMAHPDADMVAVKAIAGFELAAVFAEWAQRAEDHDLGDLGLPRQNATENNAQFGERIARGILKLLKEV